MRCVIAILLHCNCGGELYFNTRRRCIRLEVRLYSRCCWASGDSPSLDKAKKKKIVCLSSTTFPGQSGFFPFFSSSSFSHKISVGRENFFKTFYFLKNVFGLVKSRSVGRSGKHFKHFFWSGNKTRSVSRVQASNLYFVAL